MSLINQVLNDLEQRRADMDASRLPRDVRPLPVAESGRGRLIGAGVVLLVVIGAAIWGWQAWGPGRPLPTVPELPAQVVVNAAMPPLALPNPAASPDSLPVSSGVAQGDGVPVGIPDVAVMPAARSDALPSLRLSSELRAAPAARMDAGALQASPAGAVTRAASVRETPVPAMRTDPAPALALTPAVAAQPVEPAETSSGLIEKQPVAATAQERAERLYRSALAQINLGRTDDGLTTLRAALREDAAHVAARQTLVRMYVESRSWDAAAGVLRDGLERRPEQAPWAMLLSRLLVDRGDNAGALQVLEKHEAAGRGNAAYLAGLAAILQRNDRHADAAVRYEQASRLEPANGRWWLGLATAKEASGLGAEARDAYQRAAGTRNLPADLQAFAEAKLK